MRMLQITFSPVHNVVGADVPITYVHKQIQRDLMVQRLARRAVDQTV